MEEFRKLHQYLERTFPLVYRSGHVEVSTVNEHSLVFEWTGKEENWNQMKPVLFCAHLDVVPVGNVEDWIIHDPFSGKIDDETDIVWERGAIDNKHNVIAQLFAIEHLLAKGVTQLERLVFVTCGHDEEIGGDEGAKHIVSS